MITKNICRYIPKQKDCDSIQTINFVLETKKQEYKGLRNCAVYIMYYVLEGSGILHMKNSSHSVSAGDVFFSIPGVQYAIESVDNFKYMYISYLGTRANMIMDKLKINSTNCVFYGFEDLRSMWADSVDIHIELSDLRTESLLLYTFSCIDCAMQDEAGEHKTVLVAKKVKKFIDEHLTDPDLSLDKIRREISYNKTYISSIFKENYKIGISDYITTARIQAACTLMEQGCRNIADIAFFCGFNDPLYFSKVFKVRLGVSPRKHIKNIDLMLDEKKNL